ncbi:MAG TPA: CHASE2 domain-containing protein [Rhizomicrobium sp.]|jgi:serine phosphatase RsbU (regulator of sigma subunit)
MQRLNLLFKGWGRRTAWAALIVFVAIQGGFPALTHAPRLALFDFYERTFPRLEHTSPVVIVAIDERSLRAVGQWPWPRQIDAQLISKILVGHPAALGLDLILPERDRQSPEEWLRYASAMPASLQAAIRRLPSHDSLLRDAIAKGPVMIGVAGLRLAKGEPDSGPLAPFRVVAGNGALKLGVPLPRFDAALRSIPLLDNAAAGHGVLSIDADSDGLFRRLPMVSSVSGRLAPSLSLEMLRLAAKAPWIDLYPDGDGDVLGLGVGPLTLPTQKDGSIWVNFSPHDPRRFVSAVDLLSGWTDARALAQRIVLIGITALGTIDQRLTPVGYMPGAEIHAQLLENVLEGRLAHRPNWARYAEPALALLLGLWLIVMLPLVRLRWQVFVGIIPLLLLAALGIGFWRQSLALVDVATPAIGDAFIFVSLLAGSFVEADTQRRRLRRELEERKIASARAEGELAAGHRIQMGMLPTVTSVAGDRRFDLHALIVPARQIGGDLFDFFKIDRDRLYFSIGDVSGKGVPAALFMTLGKSLCHSWALRGETEAGTILAQANAEISRDNPEMLFITLFAGILNLQTGELGFCNAGHEPPYLLRPRRPPDHIASMGGPPLCVVEDFPYTTETIRLEKGDLLCLMTDGVGEAMTATGELLGSERVRTILAGVSENASAKAIAEGLHAGVNRFVAGAEASDDLAILTLRWNG